MSEQARVVSVFESIKAAVLSSDMDGAGVTSDSRPAKRIARALSARAAGTLQTLSWQSSIVDLMKLVGLDWRLDQRKRLARELRYTGDSGNSAGLDVWLHRAVMRELARSLAASVCQTPRQNDKAQIRMQRRRFAITNWENEGGATFKMGRRVAPL